MDDPRDLTLALKSQFPIITIDTREEARVLALIERVANMEMWPLFVWSVARGLHRAGANADIKAPYEADPEATRELPAALRQMIASPQHGVFVLLDPKPYLEDPVAQRLVKEFAQNSDNGRRTLVLIGADSGLPQELRRLAATFALAMTDAAQIKKIFQEEIDLAQQQSLYARIRGDHDAAQLLVRHLVGMCAEDARRLIRQAVRDDGIIDMNDVARVLKYKHEALGQGGVLQLEVDCGNFAQVAGLANLKHWLELRKAVFLEDGSDGGLDPPRGLLLLGVQGSGKSMAAKAVAGSWGVPLLRMDFGALYSKWSGETEKNLRDSLKVADAMEPAVLWIDEIEKGLSAEAGEADGGMSRRVLGTLLTWMNERKSRVFLAATANDIATLPPELMRKGRFDEIFFVDLPDDATRAEIFRRQLARRKQAPEGFDLRALAAKSVGFSGAEIEQAVVSALYAAKASHQPMSSALVAEELARTRPLSVVMAEKIAALRAWASSRTVPAN
ncbi:MAG TPA: AAA family ATPase [Nevskiaceae bacterium]|nr:AAA family ATPase [Nevskiaceae bacterium]